MRLLVVEDDGAIRDFLGRALTDPSPDQLSWNLLNEQIVIYTLSSLYSFFLIALRFSCREAVVATEFGFESRA